MCALAIAICHNPMALHAKNIEPKRNTAGATFDQSCAIFQKVVTFFTNIEMRQNYTSQHETE